MDLYIYSVVESMEHLLKISFYIFDIRFLI